MDPVLLSRLQFALATFFHFIYVPLTLGLGFFIAIMETRYVRTGDEKYKAHAKYWGRIFLINFALGVVTGITLEFQFGTNWRNYSAFVGDIFGSLLAIEATATFFLESTFLAVWAFGWERVSKKVHLLSIWLVSFAGIMSALWIILANGFMQNPVGYKVDGSRLVLDDFLTVITNPYGWSMYFHTVFGAMVLCAFLVMGVSALNIFLRRNADFFQISFRMAAVMALVFSTILILSGHQLGQVTAKYQPAKLAAMESIWETKTNAPMYLLTIPPLDESEENLVEELPINGFLSFLATGSMDGKVEGLKEFAKEDRPSVMPIFLSFRAMVGLGTLFFLVSIFSFLVRKHITKFRYTLLLYVLMIPLPYLALQLGWVVTEMGRQPWVVYNIMRTSMAGSPVDWYQIAGSLLIMGGVYTLLTITGIALMIKAALTPPCLSGECTSK